MFSTVMNSCDLFGEEFIGSLQTKDLECLLDYYWISPGGELFKVEGWGAFEEALQEGDGKMRYRATLKPYKVTNVIRLYTVHASRFIEVCGFFRLGKLVEVIPHSETVWVPA